MIDLLDISEIKARKIFKHLAKKAVNQDAKFRIEINYDHQHSQAAVDGVVNGYHIHPSSRNSWMREYDQACSFNINYEDFYRKNKCRFLLTVMLDWLVKHPNDLIVVNAGLHPFLHPRTTLEELLIETDLAA